MGVAPSPVNAEQWQSVGQRLSQALQDPSLCSPAQSPVGSPVFHSPVSRGSPSPVHVANWQVIGHRMAQLFQDSSLASSPSGSPSTVSMRSSFVSSSPRGSPNGSPLASQNYFQQPYSARVAASPTTNQYRQLLY